MNAHTETIRRSLERVKKLEGELAWEKENLEKLKKGTSEIESCFAEADEIIDNLDEWMKRMMPPNGRILYSDMPASVLFLGGCSGQWAARSRYTGTLPGFGGFLLVADDRLILVDPGLSTVDGLIAAGIPPSSLHSIIVTHCHWDCVRDLGLVLMAASGPAPELTAPPNPSLRLFASESIVHGFPMDVDAVLAHKSVFHNWESEEELRRDLRAFSTSQPAVLNTYDIFGRLGNRFDCLEHNRRHEISAGVHFYTRPSYHWETFGAEMIPGLDFVIRADGDRRTRIAYLSDTEYRPHLHEPYSEAVEDLGQIDVLIANVKTLSAFRYEEGSLEGYTRRQLGWKGVLQLTRDLRESGALSASSLVVLRAWGIETVTRLDPENGELVATPEKLAIYERVFTQETGQPALVPGRTWVGVPGVKGTAPSINYLRRPFPDQEDGSRFGGVFYRSEAMRKVVQESMAVMGTPHKAVLLTGESGCGKNLIADAIHDKACALRLRENQKRIKNGKEFASELGPALLFGTTEGSYTGAKNKKGWLSQASNGTVVIDELQNMGMESQGLLLTFLDQRRFQPLGGSQEQEVTAQVIFTTNIDPKKAVERGLLRSDLLYRLREIHIPPLRERKEDIEAIVQGWHNEGKLPEKALNKEVISLLEQYPWPGNVRQLEDVLEEVESSGDWSLNNIRKVARKVNRHHVSKQDQNPGDQRRESYLDQLNQEVVRFLSPNKAVGMREIQRELLKNSQDGKRRGCSDAALVNRLNRLIESDLVVRVGRGPNTEYLLKGEGETSMEEAIPEVTPDPKPPSRFSGRPVANA